MTDLETRLRAAMRTVAPAPERFDAAGLTEGARRYAVRSRRLRIASTALAAAVVVGIVGTSSVMFRDRATEPAVPGPASVTLCPQLQKTITSLSTTSPASAAPQAVLVCALVGGDSVWPGSLPPDMGVDQRAALELLDWRPSDDADATECSTERPHGRAFTVSVRDRAGLDRTYPNTDLLCDGWVFLDSYYVALAEQGTDYRSHQPAPDSYPVCPSVLTEASRRFGGEARALPKGTVLTVATVCTHPTVDPFAVKTKTVPRAAYVRRLPMGERDLATLNANLARTGAQSRTEGCDAKVPRNSIYVVRAVTSTGAEVNLRAHADCLPTFDVNNDNTATITLDQETVDLITGPLDRFP